MRIKGIHGAEVEYPHKRGLYSAEDKSMLRKTRLLGILVFVSFLIGCGGGGTTTKGAGSAPFNIAPYVGNWSGEINGQNVYGFAKFSFNIGETGGVLDLRPDQQCPKALSGKYINSNPFKWVQQFECFVPGLGVCRVTESGTLHLSGGNWITGEYTQNGACGVNGEPPFNYRGDFSYLKRSGSFQL